MKVLSVDLENCFGIGSFKFDFEFESNKTNSFLIYAPNGTMKTSFSKTFDLIARNEPKNMPRDKVYQDRQSKYEVLCDGNTIDSDTILVVNAEDTNYDASEKISSFIASKELKNQYESIYKELNYQKDDFIRKLRSVSKSTDCEGEFIGAFSDNPSDNFYDILLVASENFVEPKELYSFKYNEVFDKTKKVKDFLEKNENILDQYFANYKDLISKSTFFKTTGDTSFGTYQANVLLKSIEDNSFFDAGHTLVLEDGKTIKNSSELREVVQKEIESIINDATLKASFNKVDTALIGNADLRKFKKVIEGNNLLLIELKDYEGFKKKVWNAYLSLIRSEMDELVSFYSTKKGELEKIISESQKQVALWNEIVGTFNNRFYVPFEVSLGNQQDVILKATTAKLTFKYSEDTEEPITKEKNELLEVLSRGEKRAYFILQFLFEIESRRNNGKVNLIVFDDIADSFDYKNKFAIIEYIKELKHSDNFKTIILTHNFDFFRTVTSRLELYENGGSYYFANRNSRKEVRLIKGFDTRNVFKGFLGEVNTAKAFISCIAFARNIIEYFESSKAEDYKTLTKCLHIKDESSSITAGSIFQIYLDRFNKIPKTTTIPFAEKNIIDLIIETADLIIEEVDSCEISLYNKIVLAMAIRLAAEKYMIGRMPELKLEKVYSQTIFLSEKYKADFPTSKSLKIIDKVNLMTPENIHVNAFMFEPLVDMSLLHLKKLYTEVKEL